MVLHLLAIDKYERKRESTPLKRKGGKAYYSKGLVRVPHQVRNTERPTVSRTLARTLTPTVSKGRFSMRISLKNWGRMVSVLAHSKCDVVEGKHTVGALLAMKIRAPR